MKKLSVMFLVMLLSIISVLALGDHGLSPNDVCGGPGSAIAEVKSDGSLKVYEGDFGVNVQNYISNGASPPDNQVVSFDWTSDSGIHQIQAHIGYTKDGESKNTFTDINANDATSGNIQIGPESGMTSFEVGSAYFCRDFDDWGACIDTITPCFRNASRCSDGTSTCEGWESRNWQEEFDNICQEKGMKRSVGGFIANYVTGPEPEVNAADFIVVKSYIRAYENTPYFEEKTGLDATFLTPFEKGNPLLDGFGNNAGAIQEAYYPYFALPGIEMKHVSDLYSVFPTINWTSKTKIDAVIHNGKFFPGGTSGSILVERFIPNEDLGQAPSFEDLRTFKPIVFCEARTSNGGGNGGGDPPHGVPEFSGLTLAIAITISGLGLILARRYSK